MTERMTDERLAEIRSADKSLHSESSLTKNQRHRRELLAEVERLRAFEDAARPVIEAADAWLGDGTPRHQPPFNTALRFAVRAYREATE